VRMEANAVGGPSLASLPDVLTVDEARQVLRLGRNAIYQAIHRQEIPSIRIGRRLLIPKREILTLLGGASDPDRPEVG
jgi:excisionase family DNA binding protein